MEGYAEADETTDKYVCLSRTFKKRVEFFFIFPGVFVIICRKLKVGLEGESLREKGGFAR